MQIADLLSIISISLSVFFTIFTLIRDKKRNQTVDRLNELLLQKEINEVKESQVADFDYDFYQNGGSGSYCIQLTNCGKSPAYDFNVELVKGDWDLMLDSFPYRIVQPNQDININTAVFMGCKEKIEILLTWRNSPDGEIQKKEYEIGL